MNIASFFYNLSAAEWIIIGIYLLFFTIQILYYLLLFRKPYKHIATNPEKEDGEVMPTADFPGISVILTAKNEAENLKNNLPHILNQDYPKFQVVVVNNGSTDDTSDVLSKFSQSYKNLYHTYIPEESKVTNGKKLALTLGIKAATYDYLVFTEADTKPLSSSWVYQYAKEFRNGKEVVLGACQLKLKRSFAKKLIQFDNLFFGIEHLSMALANKPYMGIGRNMGYKKELFFENKGFSSILNIEYGEDNLFINKVATKENTAVILSPDSMIVSNVVEQLSIWRTIKSKYLITRKFLKGNKSRWMDIELFSRIGFYLFFLILLGVGIFQTSYLLIGFSLLLFLIRYIIQVIILNKNSKIFAAGKFYLSLPIYDLVAPIMNYQFLRYEKERNIKRR